MSNVIEKRYYRGGPVTPWGRADSCYIYPNGVKFYSTPGHGGFFIPKALRSRLIPFNSIAALTQGYYEEDCEALKVMLSFPELFQERDFNEIKKAYDYWFNQDGSYRSKS